MVQSQSQAKRFFANRVVHQASSEGLPLSDAERWMLSWSESDPEFKADSELLAAFQSQVSEREYEAKICGLLRRSFQSDLAGDPGAKDKWRQAFAVVKQGDHYISIMIDRAVGSKLRSWSHVWGLRAVPAPLVAIFVLGAYQFLVRALFLGWEPSRDDQLFIGWALMMALAIVYGLLRFALGGKALDDSIGRIVDRIFGTRRL